jgi:hypothetical protein
MARAAAAAAVALFSLGLSGACPAAPPGAVRLFFDPLGVVPGAAVPVVVEAESGPLPGFARAGGETFPLLPLPPLPPSGGEPGGAPRPRALALVGVDAGYEGKLFPVEFPGVADDEGKPLAVELPLSPVEYGVQKLTLPKKMVDYPKAEIARIEREAHSLALALTGRTAGLALRRAFARPVEGRISAGFGGARVLNGEARAPHGGEDIAAATGTPVLAANDGRVALVGNFYLTGRTVVVDHGQGIFTLYGHMSKIRLGYGSMVERGAVIGWVGATGRATGPHLHYGVILRGVKIDPESLRALEALY